MAPLRYATNIQSDHPSVSFVGMRSEAEPNPRSQHSINYTYERPAQLTFFKNT